MPLAITEEQLQRLQAARPIIMGIVLAITFISTVTGWHTDWQLTHTLPAVSAPSSSTSAQLIAAIPNNHLFGRALNGADDLPVTSLQLHVTGIMKLEGSDTSDESRASISIAGQPSKIYQVGDQLPDGVKIYQILNDAVILENDGQLEKLPLTRTPLEFKPPMTDEDLQ